MHRTVFAGVVVGSILVRGLLLTAITIIGVLTTEPVDPLFQQPEDPQQSAAFAISAVLVSISLLVCGGSYIGLSVLRHVATPTHRWRARLLGLTTGFVATTVVSSLVFVILAWAAARLRW